MSSGQAVRPYLKSQMEQLLNNANMKGLHILHLGEPHPPLTSQEEM